MCLLFHLSIPPCLGKLNTSTTFRVGVILDMASCVGQINWKSFSIAKKDFYAAYPNYITRLVLVNKDSKDDVLGAASAGTPSLAFCLFVDLRTSSSCVGCFGWLEKIFKYAYHE
ncbi:Glutamate receptor 2.2 [Acorus gramineus]|uniref:Glutamate receptor 2.2 n=1 Tax=Acorus gramineus TaxID=55184 RepID=A0AAV9BL08_ACOGR|nr:Glutamate receptor 2.2 [Acorus gramineus]